jgi:hypothetical protein
MPYEAGSFRIHPSHIADLDIHLRSLRPGTHRLTCPKCSNSRSKRTQQCLAVTVDHETAAWFCHHCGWKGRRSTDGSIWHDGRKSNSAQQRYRRDLYATVELARRLWTEAEPITGTIAERYVRIFYGDAALPDFKHALRFHPQVWRRFDHKDHPALLCALRSLHSDEFQALQRIALKSDGSDRLRDADDHAKKPSLGPTKDSVCMLTPGEEITHGINLVEGVEDGVALLGCGWGPVWATCGKENMRRILVGAVDAVTFWADNDEGGLEAAYAGQRRWLEVGREASVIMLNEHKDLGDYARSRRGR